MRVSHMKWLLISILLIFSGPTFAYERKELIESRLNPELIYRTIATDHFEIHYPQHLEVAARKFEGLVEVVRSRLISELLLEGPGKTHIVLTDRSDQTTLFSITFPHPQIFIDISLPSYGVGLSEYADWYEWILTHEYAHIIQLSIQGEAYEAWKKIFGATAQPNSLVPVWFKEGVSTYLESKLTRRGRGDGPFYRMYMRAAAAENLFQDSNFLSKDNINDLMSPTWPWNLRSYFAGYYLVKRIEENQAGASREIIKKVGEKIPYSFENVFRSTTGYSVEEYLELAKREWEDQATRENKKIEVQPLTKLNFLTNTGFTKSGLLFDSHKRRLLMTDVNPENETKIKTIDLHEKNTPLDLLFRSTGSQMSLSKSSRYLVYDESSHADRFSIQSNLVLIDLKDNRYVSSSRGLRARDPDIFPDGKHIVYVESSEGKNRLVKVNSLFKEKEYLEMKWDPDLSRMSTSENQEFSEVFKGDDEIQKYSRISSPRIDSSGNRIVMTIHNDESGGEDLVLWDSGKMKKLVSNGNLNFHPQWIPNKNMIIFTSDLETEVFNLFTYDLETHAINRITNVIGGLFYPVVDGDLTKIYAISYHGKGYDVVKLDGTNFQSVVKREISQVKVSKQTNEISFSESANYEALKYLGPQYLTPSVRILPRSSQWGFSLGASDPLFMKHYEVSSRFDINSKEIVGKIYYFDGSQSTAWDFEGSRQVHTVSSGDEYFIKDEASFGIVATTDRLIYHSYLRPFFGFRKLQLESELSHYQVGLNFNVDQEFTQLGLSYPEQGYFLDVVGIGFFNKSENAESYQSLTAKWRWHKEIKSRWVYHLGLESVYLFLPSSVQNDYSASVGGQWSFPYIWNSDLSLMGFSTKGFSVHEGAIISQRVSFEIENWQKQTSMILPVFLRRLSGAIVFQVAALKRIEQERLQAWSTGLEFTQDFVGGEIFSMKGLLGFYHGDPSHGGEDQILVAVEHSL